MSSNAYTNQVYKGGEMLRITAKEDHKEVNRKAKTKTLSQSNGGGGKKKRALNKNLKRARKLSKLTEKMSKAMLDGLGVARLRLSN